MRGPIDFLIVAFQGSKFDGAILKALTDALDKGIIGLVALSILYKDSDGEVTTSTVAGEGDQYVTEFTQRYKPQTEHIDEADIQETGESLEPDSAAALLVIEHLWAIPLQNSSHDILSAYDRPTLFSVRTKLLASITNDRNCYGCKYNCRKRHPGSVDASYVKAMGY